MPAVTAETIKNYIAESQLPEAIEQLIQAWQGREQRLYNLTLQVKARYNFLQNEISKGVISQSDADLERARITDALLFLTDRLSNPQLELPRHLQAYFSTAKPNNRKTLLISAGILLLLIVAYSFWQNASTPSDFSLKMVLQAPPNSQEAIAHQTVQLFFGDNLFGSQELDSEGKAIFTDIPNKFWQDSIHIQLQNPGFQILSQSAASAATSDKGSITFQLESVTQYTNWRGTVSDEKGKPVAQAILNIDSGLAMDTTDLQGNFQVQVPRASGERVQVMISYQGKTYSHSFVLSESIPLQINVE